MPWVRLRYRGNKVWVLVDEAGAPVLDERKLASLRYKPEDERTYTVRPAEIRPLEEEEAPQDGPGADALPEGESDAVRVYTDGASSGNPGPAGLGVVLLWREHRKELARSLGEATNNEAELAAVLAGLEAVRRPELPVRLHTDSEYVLGLLTRGHKVKANIALVDRIRRQMERFADLQLLKVPAHAGIPENERADALAREGSQGRERG